MRVDHWGYYNSYENYFETLPAQYRFSWTDVEPYFNSRTPNPTLIQAEILTQINYPTGGSTFLEYELNSYSRQANKYPFNVTDVTEQVTGGLRIKKIHSSTTADEELMTREYFYVDGYASGDMRSSGILSGTPDYLEIDSFKIEANNGSFQTVRYWNITNNNINPLSATNGRHVTYTNIVEKFSDGGYREIKYSNHENGTSYLDEPPLSIFATFHLRPKQDPHISMQRVRGKPLRERIYRNDNTLLQEKNYQYEIPDDEIHEVRCINKYQKIFFKQSDDPALPSFFIEDIRATAYLQYLFPVHLTSESVTRYDENGQNPVSEGVTYEYNSDNNLIRIKASNCNDNNIITTYKYPRDYNATIGLGNPTYDDMYRSILSLKFRNINNVPIETLNFVERYDVLNPPNFVTYVIGGQINGFERFDNGNVHQIAVYQLETNQDIPEVDFQASVTEIISNGAFDRVFTIDSRYQQVIDITEHSSTGTPLEAKRTKDEPVSVLMSKDELRPIARVISGAYRDIAYTSFESVNDVSSKANGRWTISGEGGGWSNASAYTGINAFNLSNTRDATTSVRTAGDYILTFWAKVAVGFEVSVSGAVVQSTANTSDWAYYEVPLAGVPANSIISITGIASGEKIDELRLYPKNALMSTYTYDPESLQVTSMTDANNKTNYFEYDSFERLQYVYDQNKNLIGYNDYQYKESGALQNHIQSIAILEEGKSTTDISMLTLDEKQQTFQYFDGLGRLTQSVGVGQSPLENDVVQIAAYDDYGREVKQYLPYTIASSNGSFRGAALAEQSNFYTSGGTHVTTDVPFAETLFEYAPLNRAKQQAFPGTDWQMTSGNTVGMEYGVSEGSTIYNIQFPGAFGYAGQRYGLFSEKQTDENGNISINYTKRGKLMATRRNAPDGKYADTYYHYDDYGNIINVIPPQAIDEMLTCNETNGSAPAGLLDLGNCGYDASLQFSYQYDERQRVIAKKIPGADWMYYVYDILDRVVMTQSGRQRTNDRWHYAKYDNLGRPVMTGFFYSTDDRATIQNTITTGNRDGSIPLYESRTATGYTNVEPNGLLSEQLLTITFYDDYDLDANGNDDYSFIQDADFPDNEPFYRLKGQVTVTRAKVLGTTNTWLNTAYFYDEYGRVIQTQADNHLGGQEITHNEYDFVGALLKTERQHTAPGKPNIDIAERYEYDHTRRLTDVYHSINGAPETHLKNIQYNELGQAITMNLHETATAEEYLQAVDYRYNERGWLTRINNVDTGPKCCTEIDLHVILEGAYDPSTGEMTTTLNTSRHLLPGQTPASPLAIPTPTGNPYYDTPWGYNGVEGFDFADADYTTDVTDWILVSFRSNTAPNSEIFKTAALLLKDGSVQFLNDFALPDEVTEVYIVVEHLNHAGVISPQPVQVQNGTMTYDFTAADSYATGGTGQKEIAPGLWAMVAGDGTFGGDIGDVTGYDVNGADKSLWFDMNGVFDKYNNADFDRNGDVNGGDKSKWEVNNGVFSALKRNIYPAVGVPAPQGASTQTDLFSMHLYYQQTYDQLVTTPQYNGNISHVEWQTNGDVNQVRAYRYNYDQLDRLTRAAYRPRGTNGYNILMPGEYSVNNISYDLNGNILSLTRAGLNASANTTTIDDLTYEYTFGGNRLSKVTDDGTAQGFTDGTNNDNDYGYDANGNITSDKNKGITDITYNYLNLPRTITFTNGTITFQYDANGNKLSKTVSTGTQKDYLGGIEYNNGVVEAVYHEEGRTTPQGSNWQYEYNLKDQLGNTRVVFTDNNNDGTPEVIEEFDYYPFGMQHESGSATATNHYLYNGKELNTDLGLNWYDYGARWYDKALGRWNAPDPLAEKFDSWSGYHYTLNNPINYTDPNGMDTLYIHAELLREVHNVYIFNVTMSLVQNGVETGVDFIGEDGERQSNIYFVGKSKFYNDDEGNPINRWYNIDDKGNEGSPIDAPVRFESYKEYENVLRLKYVGKKGARIMAHEGQDHRYGTGCQVTGCSIDTESGINLVTTNDSQEALARIRSAYDTYITSSQKKDKYKRDVQVPAKDYDFRLKTNSRAPLSPSAKRKQNIYLNATGLKPLQN